MTNLRPHETPFLGVHETGSSSDRTKTLEEGYRADAGHAVIGGVLGSQGTMAPTWWTFVMTVACPWVTLLIVGDAVTVCEMVPVPTTAAV